MLIEEQSLEQLLNGFKLFESMQKDNLGYIYRGLFTQNITDSILSLTENNLESVGESSKVKKRVFSIMVECLQNVTRHQTPESVEAISPEQSGIFVIQTKDNAYQITSGNVIESHAIPHLLDLIEKINGLEKVELKEYYKKILEEGSISDKGGAGLGLIEMARKSGNKLHYDFKKINEDISYFYLHTAISKELEEEIGSMDLANIKNLHEIVNKENIMLIFNGTLNQESLISLLSIIEGQQIGVITKKKKLFNIIVEMLQNIVKHGEKEDHTIVGNPAIFFISQLENHFILNTGNYIRNDIVDVLSSKIDLVNSLEGDDLDNFYTQRLLNFDIDNSKEAGLGIIDLRIKSGNKISYNFERATDSLSFISMQVKI